MRAVPLYKLVWAIPTVGAAGVRVQFPDVPELRDRYIIGLEAYNASYFAAVPDQTVVISAADSLNISFVFKEYSSEHVQDIPFSSLDPVAMSGMRKEFVPFVVNWQSSFVRINAAITVPCAVPVGVFYLPEGQKV